MHETKVEHDFPDHSQNFWQLCCIQAAGLGIPGMVIGGQVAQLYGTGAAISSVILGNLILWLIGFVVISMSARGRLNALQNVSHYLGKIGGVFAAFFLLLAFLSWYTLQLHSVNSALTNLFAYKESQLRIGAGLGSFIALLSLGGIQLIKKYALYVFPFLFLFVLYSIVTSLSSFQVDKVWSFSFYGTIAVVACTITGMVNLPTFFRHSRSHYDSYLGLSLMTVLGMVFQLYTIVLGIYEPSGFTSDSPIYSFFLIAFLVLSLISVNLVNIYYASAGWEMVLPHRRSNKEFVIIGLFGTLSYTFFQVSAPMQFILHVAENFIASLGGVLLFSFLIQIFNQYRLGGYEKAINFFCWVLGAIVGNFFIATQGIDSSKSLVMSFGVTSLAFIGAGYVKETSYAIMDIVTKRIR